VCGPQEPEMLSKCDVPDAVYYLRKSNLSRAVKQEEGEPEEEKNLAGRKVGTLESRKSSSWIW